MPSGYPAYHKEGPFMDPVVRCDSCKRLLLLTQLRLDGRCGCGVRKVRNVGNLSIFEWLKTRYWWRCDPKWFKLFELK